jgi:hypothetical protein
MQPDTFRTFQSAQAARDYRHEHGTGGWIFVPETAGEEVVLFPPSMMPAHIFHHPFTRGRSGKLIGQ